MRRSRDGRTDLGCYDDGSHVGSIMRGDGAGRREEKVVADRRRWIVKEERGTSRASWKCGEAGVLTCLITIIRPNCCSNNSNSLSLFGYRFFIPAKPISNLHAMSNSR